MFHSTPTVPQLAVMVLGMPVSRLATEMSIQPSPMRWIRSPARADVPTDSKCDMAKTSLCFGFSIGAYARLRYAATRRRTRISFSYCA